MAKRSKSHWAEPGYLLAVFVGLTAVLYALRKRTKVVVDIGPAVMYPSGAT